MMNDGLLIKCGKCGYDLRDDHINDCPECGANPTERVKARINKLYIRIVVFMVTVIAIGYVSSYAMIRERTTYQNSSQILSVRFSYGDHSDRLYLLSDQAKAESQSIKGWQVELMADAAANGEVWPEVYIDDHRWRYTTSSAQPSHFWRIYRLLEELELRIFPPK